MQTPIIKLNEFYLKREDQNLTGSVKDRAVELQIQNLKNKNITSAVISSTGNAAISSVYYCQKYGIDLTVFVSPKINPHKLELITPAQIIKSDTPISDAVKFSKTTNSYLLRQSTDPIALAGYSYLGLEIIQQLHNLTSIFFPVGSGTTLVGTTINFPQHIKIFAVQPASNPTIVKHFTKDIPPETESITDALSVKMLPLKARVVHTIQNSKGSGICITNQEAIAAQKLLTENQIDTSPEGALTLAGLLKAKQDFDIGEYPLIVLTGANRQ